MPGTIKLTLVNQSSDTNSSQVVIFQKNEAVSYEEMAVAWKVIETHGSGYSHPFTFSPIPSIAASDSYGNFTPQLEATTGQQFSVQPTAAGVRVVATGAASAAEDIELVNGLTQGAINACIYRDGQLLATMTGIVPGQKSVFRFNPAIWIGVASEIIEGQVMNSAIISNINTQLSLLGITEANIIMSGGGPDHPYTFTLENAVKG